MIQVEVTTRCNAKCEYCVNTYSANEKIDMSISTFHNIVDMVQNLKTKNTWLLQGTGEPLLHKNLNDMIKHIKKYDHDSEISIITNGILLTKPMFYKLINSGLTHIILSIDDTESDFEKIRKGVSWEQILSVCDMIYTHNLFSNNKIKFGFSTVAMKSNLDHLEKLMQFGKIYGVDHISIMPLVIIGNGIASTDNSIFTIDSEILHQKLLYVQEKGKLIGIKISIPIVHMREKLDILKRINNHICSRIEGLYFDVNGYIAPCCMMSDDKSWGTVNSFNYDKYKNFINEWKYLKIIPHPCDKCIVSSSIVLER